MADKIQLYEDQPIRTAWVEDEEEWYFSIVDVVGALTEQPDYQKARKYWNKLKQRLSEEGSQLVTNCHQLKMTAQEGGTIAGNARKEIEERTGQPVITSQNAKQLQNLVTGLIEGAVVEEDDKE